MPIIAQPTPDDDTSRPVVTAIPTSYAGCLFRSRLEARWAVFFDALGIAWEHEPEGFDTPAGRYLPDFALAVPIGMGYVERWMFEVKPDNAPLDRRHAALGAAHQLIVARGLPRDAAHQPRHLTAHTGDGDGRPTAFTADTFSVEVFPNPRANEHRVDLALAAARSARFEPPLTPEPTRADIRAAVGAETLAELLRRNDARFTR